MGTKGGTGKALNLPAPELQVIHFTGTHRYWPRLFLNIVEKYANIEYKLLLL